MDFTNPLIWLFLLPLVIIALILLREITKNSNTEISSKFFNFRKTDNSNIAQKLETLQRELDYLKSEISYIREKDNLKWDYKSRLNKINKKFMAILIDTVDDSLSKSTGLLPSIFHSLDEYKIMILTIEQICHYITKKGMDDFDKNGFNKVGLGADGTFDQKIQTLYVNDKPEEYVFEIKKLFTIAERPMTIVDGFNPTDREILLPLSEFEDCVIKSLREVYPDIKDLYEFIITKYRYIDDLHEKMQ